MSDSTPTEILRDFFDAHVETHPEEATTLGVREHDARLRDPSPTAMHAELARLRATLRDCESATNGSSPTQVQTLTMDERLDLDAVVRYASFRARTIEADGDSSNMELCALPNSALQHLLLHARTEKHWLDLEARARLVPSYLEVHTANLRRGIKEGRAADRAIVQAFVDRVLPGAADSIAMLGESAKERGAPTEIAQKIDDAVRIAAQAYRALVRFAEDELLPAGRDTVRLGEREVAFRLKSTMGIDKSMSTLITLANEEVKRARSVLEREFETTDEDTLREKVKSLFTGRYATVPELVAMYQKHCDDATTLVRERKLVPVPQPLALELAPLPQGVIDGGAMTNWPAPLLDPEGRGHVLYAPDIHQHPTVSMKQLAIHEGIPGHYLQSVAWQRQPNVPRHRAVRWLGVADPIAMASGYFGTMVSVEGWAVYMEQLLFENGFFDPGRETQFFAVCDAIRAVRVLTDLELHATDITTEQAEERVASATLLARDYGEYSVLRSKRIPLQSMTYLVGERETMDLRAAALKKGESLLSFHGRILSAGPVPLSRLH
jgi:uncharacterized protein (DUF885 family)